MNVDEKFNSALIIERMKLIAFFRIKIISLHPFDIQQKRNLDFKKAMKVSTNLQ